MLRLNLRQLIDEEFSSAMVSDHECSSDEDNCYIVGKSHVLDSSALLSEQETVTQRMEQQILDNPYDCPDDIFAGVMLQRECKKWVADEVSKVVQSQNAEAAPMLAQELRYGAEFVGEGTVVDSTAWGVQASYFMKVGFTVPNRDMTVDEEAQFDGRLDYLVDNMSLLSYRGEVVQDMEFPSLCYSLCPPILTNCSAAYQGVVAHMATHGSHVIYGGRSLEGVRVLPVVRVKTRGVWTALMLYPDDAVEIKADKAFVVEEKGGKFYNASFVEIDTCLDLENVVFTETPDLPKGDAAYLVDMVQYRVQGERKYYLRATEQGMVTREGRQVFDVKGEQVGAVYRCDGKGVYERHARDPMSYIEYRTVMNSPTVAQMPRKQGGRVFEDLVCTKPPKHEIFWLGATHVDTPISRHIMDEHTQGYVPGFISYRIRNMSEGGQAKLSEIYEYARRSRVFFNGTSVRKVPERSTQKGARLRIEVADCSGEHLFRSAKDDFILRVHGSPRAVKLFARQFHPVKVFRDPAPHYYVVVTSASIRWVRYVVWFFSGKRMISEVREMDCASASESDEDVEERGGD